MAKIETLVPDIYRTLQEGAEISDEKVQEFSNTLSDLVRNRLGDKQTPRLRPSNIGEKCDRKLWLSINKPELAEKFDGPALLKFLIGDIHEAVLLFLAEAAGHSVQGKQDQIEIDGVTGSRDGVIDGRLVDVKSASPYSFQKFSDGLTPEKDAFGYLKQLNFYLHGSQEDPLVTDKEKASFFVSEKVLGKLTLDTHKKSDTDYVALIEKKRKVLSSAEMPDRGYEAVPVGKSGNLGLCTECSYCPFKDACWPNSRKFLYSNGVVTLTKVVKEPNVTEIFP